MKSNKKSPNNKNSCSICNTRDCSNIPTNKLDEGILYEFTISPCDTLQFFGEFQRTRKAVEAILKQLEILKFSCKYNLIWEYDDPLTDVSGGKDKKPISPPRLHLHGTIEITDMFELLETTLYNLATWCKYQFNPLCKDYWDKYINKQRKYIEKGFKQYELPYEVNNKTQSKLTQKKMNKEKLLKKVYFTASPLGYNSFSDTEE